MYVCVYVGAVCNRKVNRSEMWKLTFGNHGTTMYQKCSSYWFKLWYSNWIHLWRVYNWKCALPPNSLPFASIVSIFSKIFYTFTLYNVNGYLYICYYHKHHLIVRDNQQLGNADHPIGRSSGRSGSCIHSTHRTNTPIDDWHLWTCMRVPRTPPIPLLAILVNLPTLTQSLSIHFLYCVWSSSLVG